MPGDTYLLRTGDDIKDYSDLYVGQIQHGYSLGERQRFTYGLDLLLTRPDTEGSINGRNEDNDNINEIGAYLQSETKIIPQLKFIAAARGDYHNQLSDMVFSPRAALAFQPTDDHNLRLTYNRAFSTPGTSNLFLDRLGEKDPFMLGIDVRAQGVPAETGFTFKRGEGELPQFRSPFSSSAQDYINLDDADSTKRLWGGTRQTIIGIFEAGLKENTTPEALPGTIAALPPETIEGLATQAFSTLPPQALQGLPPELAPLLQPGGDCCAAT